MRSSHLEHFEELAPRFEEQKRKQRYYYDQLRRWLRYVVPEGKRVLELGSADGDLLMDLKPSSAVGMDFSQKLIDLAKARHPQGKWILQDLTKELASVGEGNLDYIIGIDILGYLQDIQSALEQVSRLCQSDTRLVFTKMNPFWGPLFRFGSWLGLTEKRRYSNWLPRNECERVLDVSGFDVIQSGKFCLLPFYIPLLSTLVNRYLAHLPLIRRFALVEFFICRKRPEPSSAHPSVSVIIPARNEKGNMRAALERMPKFPGALEVIFVEGHSKDGTWEEIQSLQKESWPFAVTSFQQTGKGKGDAVRLGFQRATNDLLMILDADLTVMPEDLPRFYRILAERRAEYVQGTRLVYPMEDQAMRPLNWLGNKTFSTILSFLLGQYVSDTLCGTKCLWRHAYEELARQRVYFGDFDPFGDFDLIFGVSRMSLKIAEIPVHYRNRVYGETQIHRFRDGMLLFKMCWFAARKMLFL